MRIRDKVLLAVALAVLTVWLFGCGQENIPAPAADSSHDVSVGFLQHLYSVYNDGYFQNKLTKAPVIDMLETNPNFMASTMCQDGSCVIHFNKHFTAAHRVARFTMLHEMCHVKTWDTEVDVFGGQVLHGKSWRACMISLDTRGAFREIIIDNYTEGL